MTKRKRTEGETTLHRKLKIKDHEPRTDNTMAKRKSTKGQTTINKTYI
jgi:hypothetical protein